MVVEPPEFDEGCDGVAAIEIVSVCHAVSPAYAKRGGSQSTECGKYSLSRQDTVRIQPREEFEDRGIPMCRSCWPDHVIGDDSIPDGVEREMNDRK